MRAAVLGANGQDGSYLVEQLLDQGMEVLALARQPEPRYVQPHGLLRYQELDLADSPALAAALTAWQPDRLYHVAAIHGASGFVYEDKWQEALRVNTGAVHACLEYMRLSSPQARLLYASSLKVFGRTPPARVSEETPRLSTCLYSITKNASAELIEYYRQTHGLQANIVYLFNHESPRRPAHFVLPRIVGILAGAISGNPADDKIRSLRFACDWGSSAEFMEMAAALLEAAPGRDHVIATGKTWSGEEFVAALFERAGLSWQDHLVLEFPDDEAQISYYRADISRLRADLGHGPQKSALDVAEWILRENHGLAL